uniref:Uncharacterized protein n=1 Tax=Panagrolaimus davidi TaxID=227884 RepID=A0A914Q6N6_9BILA
MECFKAAYKCLLKPALAIDVHEDDLEREVHEIRIKVSCKGTPFVALIHPSSKLAMMEVKTSERLGRPLKKQKIIKFFNIGGALQRQTQTPSKIQDPMNESSFVLPTEDELKMHDPLNWSKDFELVENMASTFGERSVINFTLNKVDDFNFFFRPQIPLQEHINEEAIDNESLAEIMAYE